MEKGLIARLSGELTGLEEKGNLRRLPSCVPDGCTGGAAGVRMVNLSSNDYLGLAADRRLQEEFLESVCLHKPLFSASSSRLLTGNSGNYEALEKLLAGRYGTESALVFNSGYHLNTGILPAVCDARTLIMADKLVHASIIDGIRLSSAKFMRYPHLDTKILEGLLVKYASAFETVVIVTESIFSMDGDEADLRKLAELKEQFPNVMLYVDEAHAVGVRGKHGLGCAEEQECIGKIDFLAGTFGKALASVGGYVVCRRVIRDYLVNRMRTLIFTTALPPVNLQWTKFVLERLDAFAPRREFLARLGGRFRTALAAKGCPVVSTSHIVPLLVGGSPQASLKAEDLRRKGFYVLPVRPPTVPEGTSRIRFSLTAGLEACDLDRLMKELEQKDETTVFD